MPPIPIKYVVSFSSQDDRHPVTNLLKGDGFKKWLSSPHEKSGQIEAVFQLENASVISYIDMGSIWCASIEIKVGCSDWPMLRDFETLVYTVNLMTPAECLQEKNPNQTKMFSSDLFCPEVARKEWDRIKVICRQPYRKLIQFGLSFIRVKSNVTASVSGSNKKETATAASVMDIQKHFLGKLDNRLNKDDSHLKSRLLKLASTADASGASPTGVEQDDCLSRTAKLVLAASATKNSSHSLLNSPRIGRAMGTPGKLLVSPCLTGLESNKKLASPQSENKQTRPAMYSSCVQQKNAPKLEDEIKEFLASLSLDRSHLDEITMADLRHRFEKKKKRKLTKDEKRIFIELTQEYLGKMFAANSSQVLPNTNGGKENKSQCTTATSTESSKVNKTSGSVQKDRNPNKTIKNTPKHASAANINQNDSRERTPSVKRKIENDVITPPAKKPVSMIQQIRSGQKGSSENKVVIAELKKGKLGTPRDCVILATDSPFQYKGYRGREQESICESLVEVSGRSSVKDMEPVCPSTIPVAPTAMGHTIKPSNTPVPTTNIRLSNTPVTAANIRLSNTPVTAANIRLSNTPVTAANIRLSNTPAPTVNIALNTPKTTSPIDAQQILAALASNRGTYRCSNSSGPPTSTSRSIISPTGTTVGYGIPLSNVSPAPLKVTPSGVSQVPNSVSKPVHSAESDPGPSKVTPNRLKTSSHTKAMAFNSTDSDDDLPWLNKSAASTSIASAKKRKNKSLKSSFVSSAKKSPADRLAELQELLSSDDEDIIMKGLEKVASKGRGGRGRGRGSRGRGRGWGKSASSQDPMTSTPKPAIRGKGRSTMAQDPLLSSPGPQGRGRSTNTRGSIMSTPNTSGRSSTTARVPVTSTPASVSKGRFELMSSPVTSTDSTPDARGRSAAVTTGHPATSTPGRDAQHPITSTPIHDDNKAKEPNSRPPAACKEVRPSSFLRCEGCNEYYGASSLAVHQKRCPRWKNRHSNETNSLATSSTTSTPTFPPSNQKLANSSKSTNQDTCNKSASEDGPKRTPPWLMAAEKRFQGQQGQGQTLQVQGRNAQFQGQTSSIAHDTNQLTTSINHSLNSTNNVSIVIDSSSSAVNDDTDTSSGLPSPPPSCKKTRFNSQTPNLGTKKNPVIINKAKTGNPRQAATWAPHGDNSGSSHPASQSLGSHSNNRVFSFPGNQSVSSQSDNSVGSFPGNQSIAGSFPGNQSIVGSFPGNQSIAGSFHGNQSIAGSFPGNQSIASSFHANQSIGSQSNNSANNLLGNQSISSHGNGSSGRIGSFNNSVSTDSVSVRDVDCPLCGDSYPSSVIEMHAATCMLELEPV